MTDVSGDAPIPASMAAAGIEGPGEKACSPCGCKHIGVSEMTLCLALHSIEAAQAHLDVYACHTDDPAPGVVQAADLLESVRVTLYAAASIVGGSRLIAWGQHGCLEAT